VGIVRRHRTLLLYGIHTYIYIYIPIYMCVGIYRKTVRRRRRPCRVGLSHRTYAITSRYGESARPRVVDRPARPACPVAAALPLPSSHRFYETAHRSRRRSPPPTGTVSRRRSSPNPDFPHPVDDRFIFRTHTHTHTYIYM